MDQGKEMQLTPHEARELEHKGFKLIHKKMHADGTDTFEVRPKEGQNND